MKPQLIPANLSAIADCAAKESTRYAMTGIRLELEEGKYTAAATNSKILAIVEGPSADYAELPPIAGLESAPNSATSALIPAKDWKENLKPLAKNKKYKPILQNTAVVLSDHVTTFGRTDLDRQLVQSAKNVDGRFPPYKEIVPKQPCKTTVTLDAYLLATLAKTAAAFNNDDQNGIEIGITDSTKPVTIKTKNATGQVFTGLIMPMSKPKQDRAEELAEQNAARLIDNGPAMLAALKSAYQALRNVPQSEPARRILTDAYNAARPENDPTYQIVWDNVPDKFQHVDLKTIQGQYTAKDHPTAVEMAKDQIRKSCIENGIVCLLSDFKFHFHELPDTDAIDYEEPELNILDDSADDLLQLQECTVSD